MNVLKLSHGKRFVKTTIVIALALSLPLLTLLVREVGAPTIHEVKITGFAFAPQTLAINLGDTIMWNNTDPVIHTLWFVHVANGSTCLLSDPIPPDATWNHTFNDAAELQYYSFDKLWITGFINITAEIHDVAVINMTTSKTGCLPMPVVGEGYSVPIDIMVENQGHFPETFDVTVYVEMISINTTMVTLTSGNFTTLTVLWNTTGWTKGNYTLSATASTVPGEIDIADNTCIGDSILITVIGDINGDSKVDIKDLVLVIKHYATLPGYPLWNPNADINCDGKVDIKDLVLVIKHFGEHYP